MRARAWYCLYNVVLHAGAAACLPVWLFLRLVRGRYKGQFKERMGVLSEETLAPFRGRRSFWVHAASAGETVSATPLVRALRAAYPDTPLLFTVTSRYGKEMAQRRLQGVADAIAFSPLDLPLFCARFLNRFQPRLYLMVETDLWPNLVRMARRRGAAVAVASGHAGPRSFPRPFWRAVLGHVDAFWMQSERDAENLVARGAPRERVETCGNLKFDGAAAAAEDGEALRKSFGVPPGVPVLVAGSTLFEDEAPVLDAVRALRAEGLDLHAVVAPRRQERAAAIERACAERALSCARRSQSGAATVLVLDTMGELAGAYRFADVAYVGGGLTPDVGLHNILEPAVAGAPVVFGAHHGKAARIAAEFLRAGAGVEIASGEALLPALRAILAGGEESARLKRAGASLLARHQGATERHLARIRGLVA